MNVCPFPFYAVTLCLGFLSSSSLSAVVYSEQGLIAGEEGIDKNTISILEVTEKSTDRTPTEYTPESSSSSEESNSNEHNQSRKLDSSESSDSSSSEERTIKRIIKKRSLDTKQDSVNTVGESLNHTSTKENIGLEKVTHSSENTNHNTENIKPIANENSEGASTTSLVVSDGNKDEPPSESTTFELDSLYSVASETTTDVTEETATESKIEESELGNITESETESTSIEPKTTPEVYADNTTEVESIPSTTERAEDNSSENSEDEESLQANITSVELSKTEENQEESWMEIAKTRVDKLSDQIRLVLIQYRKKGVVVLPTQNFFPEPMSMQDFRQSFSVGTIDFKNMNVYGLSNFTIEHINTDVDRMQVYILLHMKKLVILGNYTLKTFFSRAAGPFNVTLLDVDSEGVAEVETTPEGHLEAADSQMDMFTKDMLVDFKNLGFMGSMFQGVVSTVGDALFNSIKPQILDRVNIVIRTDINKKLKEFSVKFINKISPVDLAFSEGRKYVKENGYDPFNIGDHTFLIGGLMNINITDFWVEGLSRFYRVGNLSISMDSGVVEVGVHVVTDKLKGRCKWSGETFGITKFGKTNFTVDHLQVRALVKQSLDIRKKPVLDDLDLELGWVKVTMDSPMTLNMMIEGIINAFPRLIRHIIVDTLEEPLKEKIQEILDKINVESIVKDNLPRLDKFGL